jgi:hypothetical protein
MVRKLLFNENKIFILLFFIVIFYNILSN